MRLIYHNDWDLYTLTESSENASYPAENTQDIRLVKTWRTSTASAATIYMDAGSGATATCDCAAILNHNFTASAGICVQAATAQTFASIALSANVTYRSGPMVVYFTSGSYRYWRFNFDETTLAAGYYEVGRLFLGTYVQVDPTSLVEFPVKHVRNDRQTFSRSNQLYADEGVGWKELHYKFPRSTNAMKGSVETMWGSVGLFQPILFMNYDTTFSIIEPLYCSITENIVFEHLRRDEWRYELHLREVN